MKNTTISFKTISCLIVLLGLSFCGSTQMADSLANYYFYINQAELLISENNFQGANEKYKKAKEFKINWFGKDNYNFALLQLNLSEKKSN